MVKVGVTEAGKLMGVGTERRAERWLEVNTGHRPVKARGEMTEVARLMGRRGWTRAENSLGRDKWVALTRRRRLSRQS